MNETAAKTRSSKLAIWHVLTGMLVWGAIGYVAIFIVLDMPEDRGQRDSLPAVAETSQPLLEQTESSDSSTEPDTAIETSPEPFVRNASLSSSWMANVSLEGGWYVHVGSYESNVQAEVERLKYSRLQKPVQIQVSEDQLTHLFVGPFHTEDEAALIKKRIEAELGVRRVAIQQVGSPKSAAGTAENQTAAPEPPVPAGTWYLQIGAFSKVENARQLGEEARSRNYPVKLDTSGTGFIRVLVGPYPSRDGVVSVQSEVIESLSLRTVIIREIEE